ASKPTARRISRNITRTCSGTVSTALKSYLPCWEEDASGWNEPSRPIPLWWSECGKETGSAHSAESAQEQADMEEWCTPKMGCSYSPILRGTMDYCGRSSGFLTLEILLWRAKKPLKYFPLWRLLKRAKKWEENVSTWVIY